eukprot:scaffold69069_cov17-Tisochrysis_lutea.AAC.2
MHACTQKRVKKKRTHKRKPRLPKGYDPSQPNGGLPPPDPERWLPKWERSDFKKKKKKSSARDRDTKGGGAQSSSTGSATHFQNLEQGIDVWAAAVGSSCVGFIWIDAGVSVMNLLWAACCRCAQSGLEQLMSNYFPLVWCGCCQGAGKVDESLDRTKNEGARAKQGPSKPQPPAGKKKGKR